MTRDPEEAARRAKQEMAQRGIHLHVLDHEHPSLACNTAKMKVKQDWSRTKVVRQGTWASTVLRNRQELVCFPHMADGVHEEKAWKIYCVRGAQLANSRKFVKKTTHADQRRGAMVQKQIKQRTEKINDG